MSPMIASVQPDTKPCPAASDAARPAVGDTLKLNRISPSGPRTPPPCRPAAPLKRDSRLPRRPRNSTRWPSQRNSARMGSMVTASTTSDAMYRPAMATGEIPALRAISTPSGIPAPICVTNTRKTPQAPLGQSVGRGAVGSNRARVNWLARGVRSSLDMRGRRPASMAARKFGRQAFRPWAHGGRTSCDRFVLGRRPKSGQRLQVSAAAFPGASTPEWLARARAQERLAGQDAAAAWLHEAHQAAAQLGGVLVALGVAHRPGQLAAGGRAREHGFEGVIKRLEVARSGHRRHLDLLEASFAQRTFELT